MVAAAGAARTAGGLTASGRLPIPPMTSSSPMKFVDFNDPSIPLGTRKVAFAKWLMQKHKLKLADAKLAAHRKFGPSETTKAKKAQIRQEIQFRKAEQQAIRRYGHVSQYDTPMPSVKKEDIAGLLKRLGSSPV